jgi:GT2 family glycosyltransferase
MHTITLIMPVFNGLRFTKTCLLHLYENCQIEQNIPGINIVIVDDASTDGSYEWIQKNYPKVKLLKGNGNLWWSGGINSGVKYALESLNSEYVIWWNNDIFPEKNYFKILNNLLKSYESSEIIGSKIYTDPEFSKIWSMGGIFDPKSGKKYLVGTGIVDNNDFMQYREVDWLPGMGTIIHRSVFDAIGLVDAAKFPQYHGDSDFTYRARKAGFKIVVYPELKLYNDTTNSGIWHNNNFAKLYSSLTSIKSNYNFKKEFLFYRIHTNSIAAYLHLLKRYIKYIGGFMKWKALSLLGISRPIS